MENSSKVEFLFLNEEDMIKAGVTDMGRCVDVMTEMFELLGKGDYIMGSKNHNSHGIMIDFPENPKIRGNAKNRTRQTIHGDALISWWTFQSLW